MLKTKTEIITNYRKENNLTIKQFCRKCKISAAVYYKIMHNQLNVRASAVVRVAKELNVRLDDLIYRLK